MSTSQSFLNPLFSVVKKIKTETFVKARKLSLAIKFTFVKRKISTFKSS